MKIVIAVDQYFPSISGVVTSTYWLSKGLASLGHKIILIVPQVKGNLTQLPKHHKNISIVTVSAKQFRYYTGIQIYLPSGKVNRLISKIKPNIIHVQTIGCIGLEAIYCAKHLKIPLVITNHTFFEDYLKHLKIKSRTGRIVARQIIKIYCNTAKVVTSPSQAMKTYLQHCGVKVPIVTINNPIQINFFKKTHKTNSFSTKKFTVIYHGRISYEKSLNILIYAMAQIHKINNNIQLKIVGSGPELNNLVSLTNKLKLNKCITFLGEKKKEKIVHELHDANIFASASVTENLPMSFIEAQATGLPIIAVDAKGTGEIVEHDKTGILIKNTNPKQIIKDFVHAIVEIARNRKKQKEFAKNAIKNSSKYSHLKVAKKMISIYKLAQQRQRIKKKKSKKKTIFLITRIRGIKKRIESYESFA